MDQEQRFSAEVKIAGINPYVDVPEETIDALGLGMKAPVLVKVAGVGVQIDEDVSASEQSKLRKDAKRLQAIGRLDSEGWFRTTLVHLRGGATRLYLDTWIAT